MSFYKVVCLV